MAEVLFNIHLVYWQLHSCHIVFQISVPIDVFPGSHIRLEFYHCSGKGVLYTVLVF